METKLTQKQIGRKIAKLRKQKGYSQEDLAVNIGLSRSSIAQMELGNRNIDAFELYRLGQVLEFSLDAFMSPNYDADYKLSREIGVTYVKEPDAPYIRISTPTLNPNKFRNVLLYVLENTAGKPNIGSTVLNKLLYFCDFNYYEIYEEHLTGSAYKKLTFGPVSKVLDTIVNQMIKDEDIQRINTKYHDFPQIRLLPLKKADLTQLTAAEKDVIDHVIRLMSDWNAHKISEYSHKDLPWMVTGDGEEINYELVFYREQPYSVRNYDDENEDKDRILRNFK